jgi:hypothetical protein
MDEGSSIIDLARRLLREPDSKRGLAQEIRTLLNLPDYYKAKGKPRTNQAQVAKNFKRVSENSCFAPLTTNQEDYANIFLIFKKT